MSTKLNKSGTGLPTRLSTGSQPSSYLVDETFLMEQQRRQEEQQGHRRLAKVHAREHSESLQSAPEGELQNSILQHPDLDSQRLDGADINESPVPAQNTIARMEWDNAQREQAKEKQNRLEHNLGMAPGMGTAPKPRGPGF